MLTLWLSFLALTVLGIWRTRSAFRAQYLLESFEESPPGSPFERYRQLLANVDHMTRYPVAMMTALAAVGTVVNLAKWIGSV